jgi:TolB protein
MSRTLSQIRRIGLFAVCALALLHASAHAQLTIEITGAGANRIPVAIADFGGDPAASRILTSVIRSDLERSGLFKMIDTGGIAITETSSPIFR